MAFTYVTLQRTYETADDQPARGTVTFTPIDQMVNGLTVVSGPNIATLDTAGAISKRLAATTDPATTPVGVTYRVVEQIVGQLTRTYYVSVPHNAGSILNLADLTVIVPGAASGFALRNAADYDDSVAPTDGQVMTWDSTTSKFHPEPGGVGTGGVSSVNGATGAVTITASGLGAQPVDTDLTAFAALAPADGSFLGRTAGAWAGRSTAQTKTDLALDQVSNTSDAAKPLSTAATSALAAKAPLASPTFTGTPAAPRFVGAVQIVTYASSVTLDAAVATTFRVTATGPLTVADITNGTNGQEIWLEVLASGADRVVTVAGAATTVAAGGWWIRSLRYDQPLDTWKLVEVGGTSSSGGGGGVPDDGSVTNAKVSTTAAIDLNKTADSSTRLAMTAAERTLLSTGLTERIQDDAAGLLTGGIHSGISFAYNDVANRVDATVTPSSVDPSDPLNAAVPLAERIQFGVYANTGGTTEHATLETTLGVKIPRYVTYQVMGTGGASAWPTTHADWCKLTGHDLTIAWDILSGGPTFATILSGGNNASIDAFFTAAKNYGGPVTLRMWWEMNDANGPTKVDNATSTLFSSSTVATRRTQWIDAWRYIYNRCKTTVGASNVEFFFCANGSDTGATTIEQLWPGEQYVDVIGLDTYNETTFASWTSFSTKIAPMMTRLATLAPNLPQGIGEIGTVDTGGPAGTSKATWLQDMFATADWPKLRFVDYFSVNQTNDWRLTQTSAAITAIQTWVPRTRSGLDIDDNAGSGGGTTDTVARAVARAGLLTVDTFSRVDGALGNAESGQAWEIQSGAPTISGGVVIASAAYVAAVDVGRADMDVEATITPQASTSPSLLFRVGPTSADRLALALDSSAGLRFQKTDSNVGPTALATTAFSFTPGNPYRARVIADGASLYGFLDGELLVSYTLTSGELTKYGAYTRAGIRQNNTTPVPFDDFLVRFAYPAPSSGGIPVGAQPVYIATGDDADLTAALASVPTTATLVAVKVAGT